ELGRGAMGVVYRAEDTRLRRPVALKVLLPHVAHDESLRERFLREAQAVARLNHRNIVQVYDLVEGEDGCRIAMEFVRGPSLAELAGRQPQAIGDVLRWGSELADALACAHEQNVIHRDLKPANVLMSELTQPKITDFGLARFTDNNESQATQIGTVMGSPAYMSPEQAAGLATDARSDIYAFGILLYELLSGRPPFTGESTQVMAAQVTRAPEDIRGKRDDLPEALAALVMELLQKAPDDRPASMRVVAGRLAAMR
ncbi:MAG: serine/threonine-protein kinase, partial [Gammaproteobacteria bacterium]